MFPILCAESAGGAMDPDIDEHFRRSLGKAYHHLFDAATSAPSPDPAPSAAPPAPSGASSARDTKLQKKQGLVPPVQSQRTPSEARVPPTDEGKSPISANSSAIVFFNRYSLTIRKKLYPIVVKQEY